MFIKNFILSTFVGAVTLPVLFGQSVESPAGEASAGDQENPVVLALSPVLDRLLPDGDGEGGEWTLGTGIDFSSGDYGDLEDTEILYIPADITYKKGPWTTKVTVPWIQIKGPGSVVGGGDGGVVIGPGGGDVSTESGLGDIWASVTRSVESVPADWFFLDVVGKVKFPTADEDKGLGTGEFDYTLQLDFFKAYGKFSPMATVAYKIKGDPSGADLDNVFYASVGGDYRLNDATNFGATIDFQEASSSSADDALELFGYVGHRPEEDLLLMLYGYAGLSDGSPDAGGGLQIKLTL